MSQNKVAGHGGGRNLAHGQSAEPTEEDVYAF